MKISIFFLFGALACFKISDVVGQCSTPIVPTAGSVATCNSSPIMVTASQPFVSGLTHKWYTTAQGNTTVTHQILSSSGTYVTGVLQSYTSNTTFYVAAVNSCGESARTPVTVTVSPSLAVSGDASRFCAGNNNDRLIVPSGYSYIWKRNDSPISGATSNIYHPVSSGNYSVVLSKSGCTSVTLGPVSVTVISNDGLPTVPTGLDRSICVGVPIMMIAESPVGVTHNWYTSATGTIVEPSQVLNTSSTYATGVLKSYTVNTVYYVSSVNSCAESSRTPITVRVLDAPPVNVTGNKRFGTGTVTLVANSTGSVRYNWYSPSNVLLAIGQSYVPVESFTSSMSNYLYVKAASSNGCESPALWIDIDIFPSPVIVASSQYIIKKIPVTLNVQSAVYDTYEWRNSSNTIISTSSNCVVSAVGIYTLKVTKDGLTMGTGIDIKSQFSDMNMNYIVTSTPQVKNISDGNYSDMLIDSVTQSIQYIDGLGRVVETTVTQGSPSRNDLIQPKTYNAFGLETSKYLPYVATDANGFYRSALKNSSGDYVGSAHYNFYSTPSTTTANSTRAFAETTLESSPLARPLKEHGVGEDWYNAAKIIEHQYVSNIHGTDTGQEEIMAFKIDNVTGSLVFCPAVTGYVEKGGYYSSNQLDVKISIDEQGNAVREYTNKKGQIILKKVQAVPSPRLNSTTDWAQTYYVYDDFGNLVVVLPPEAVVSIKSSLSSH